MANAKTTFPCNFIGKTIWKVYEVYNLKVKLLLYSLTSNLGNFIDPLDMSIFALFIIKFDPEFIGSTHQRVNLPMLYYQAQIKIYIIFKFSTCTKKTQFFSRYKTV